MGITFTGSHAQLDAWIAKLRASDGVMQDISASLAEESITLVSEGFRAEKDPYGSSWAARKSNGGRALLVATGSLRGSFHSSGVSSSGFTISSGVAYSEYHQGGTRRMPARMMVPRPNDLPREWEQAYDDVALDVIEERLGA